jgi:hypothetical protein
MLIFHTVIFLYKAIYQCYCFRQIVQGMDASKGRIKKSQLGGVQVEGERTDRSGAFIFVTIQNFPSKRS